MSPPAVVVQLPHMELPVTHAQLGVPLHAAGSGWQANEPGFVAAPPVFDSQYCVPCAQKWLPHANVPCGAVQPPTSETSWPAAAAAQALL